jgi:hypothetical protein
MAQPTVHALFPIPIYSVTCDIDVSDAAVFLENDHEIIPNEHAHNYGSKTVNDYILDNPICNNLKSFIVEHMTVFADKIMCWDIEGMQVTQSWVSIKRPGEQHGVHYHPNSVLSAVFFFQEPEINTSYLKFHRPEIINQLMNQFGPSTNADKMQHSEFPWNYWSIPPAKNTLVIFPSWLQHDVGMNTSNKVRKSLAINAVPTGKFGSRHSSAEIDFSRLK